MSLKKSADKNGRTFSLTNRKYIGSKRELADRITETIISTSGMPEVFFDAFTGTGAVAASFLNRGLRRLIASDNLYTNTVILEGFFGLGEGDRRDFQAALVELNSLPGREGYITENFSGSYFTRVNCLRMDAIREEIENIRGKNRISEHTAASLLASFLLAADRAANTLGQYDAYLKNIDSKGFKNGRHVTDARVHESFLLRPLEFLAPIPRDIRNADVFDVLTSVTAGTAYLDPPYNTRQYCDNYHVLENIARWEKPVVRGKTLKFDRASLKSPFSMKGKARAAFERLLKDLRVRHVYLSYNSEGILSKAEILDLIAPYGTPKIWDIPYPVFGNGAGVSKKRTVTEYLFYFEKV